jgi:capsule biosynthesis phosphatase
MKRYCFDIDGTICAQSDIGKYSEAIPYLDRIEKINKLYYEGHYIIYFTARGMLTYNGNVSEVHKVWYDVTLDQLSKWGCKYNELILGKPSADYYVDDKAVADGNFFN